MVGGHFSFLALESACDGKAVEALDFLNEVDAANKLGPLKEAEGEIVEL